MPSAQAMSEIKRGPVAGPLFRDRMDVLQVTPGNDPGTKSDGRLAARSATGDALLLQAVHIRLVAVHFRVESADGCIGPVCALLRILGGAQSLRCRLLGLAGGGLRTLRGAERCVGRGLGMLNLFLRGTAAQCEERCGRAGKREDMQMLLHDDETPLMIASRR